MALEERIEHVGSMNAHTECSLTCKNKGSDNRHLLIKGKDSYGCRINLKFESELRLKDTSEYSMHVQTVVKTGYLSILREQSLLSYVEKFITDVVFKNNKKTSGFVFSNPFYGGYMDYSLKSYTLKNREKIISGTFNVYITKHIWPIQRIIEYPRTNVFDILETLPAIFSDPLKYLNTYGYFSHLKYRKKDMLRMLKLSRKDVMDYTAFLSGENIEILVLE